jgi:hypothetical protein
VEQRVEAAALAKAISELLAPEFRPMDAGALADQEAYTGWRQGRDCS